MQLCKRVPATRMIGNDEMLPSKDLMRHMTISRTLSRRLERLEEEIASLGEIKVWQLVYINADGSRTDGKAIELSAPRGCQHGSTGGSGLSKRYRYVLSGNFSERDFMGVVLKTKQGHSAFQTSRRAVMESTFVARQAGT